MTATRRSFGSRRWVQLALIVAVAVYGLVGFPTPDDAPPAAAHDRQSCIHVEAGVAYNPPRCTSVPHEHDTYPPPTCQYGGTYPNCNSRPLRPCAYGGTPGNCNQQPSECRGLTSSQCRLVQGGSFQGCTLQSTSSHCQTLIGGSRPQLVTVYNQQHPDSPIVDHCDSGVHGDACEILRELGVPEDLLAGSGGGSATFDEARRIAEETCRRNPLCDQAVMREAWDDLADSPTFRDDLPLHRGSQATVMCESYGGGEVCNEEPEAVVEWMCSSEYTQTFVSGGCNGTAAEVLENYGWDTPMTQAQSWSFNARTLEEVGYIPPVELSPRVNNDDPDSPCINGLAVIQAHVTSDDNGCRPPNCDFGRASNGWCEHPTNTDPPVIYVRGPGDVDEDADTASFRVVLSHATTQPVSVTVSTADGTATAGSDYRAVNRRITLPVNRTVRYVPISIINDRTYEGEEGETFMLEISAPSSNAELATTAQADTTIIDNDVEPFAGALPDVTAVCVDGEITFSWRRPARVAGLTSYSYLIADNIHLFSTGEFYETGRISDLDQTSVTVAVTDTSLTYYAGVRTNLYNAWAETDDFICTESPPVVSLDDTSLTVTEGSSVTINASLTKTPADAASVGLNASGAIASPGVCGVIPDADFTASAEQFAFTNTTSASVTLTACDDTDTTDETVRLALTTTGISGLQLGSPTTVVVTITDDDTSAPLLK